MAKVVVILGFEGYCILPLLCEDGNANSPSTREKEQDADQDYPQSSPKIHARRTEQLFLIFALIVL